jgi:hypothetical protein
MHLSDMAIRNAKPKEKPYKLNDGDGMHLLVLVNGGRYWRFRYYFAGKEKLMALGVYPEVSLAEARELRAKARKELRSGNDPMEVKHEAKRLQEANSKQTFEIIAVSGTKAGSLAGRKTTWVK